MYEDTLENRDNMRMVADELIGTRDTLEETLEYIYQIEDVDLTDFDIQLLIPLDDQILQCDACGWWTDTGFLSDELICDECEPWEDDEE
ncbi:MAG: hypothetical protein ACOH2T_19110 [Pseudomonas sp.]